VVLLVQNDDNIARFQTWLLIAFAVENDLLTIHHTLFDVDFQDLALSNNLIGDERLLGFLGMAIEIVGGK